MIHLILELGRSGKSWPMSQSLPACQVSHLERSLQICHTDKCAVFSPLASSMFAPGIRQIAKSFDASGNEVIACQTGFVVMLGIGPLILAPLSETFGRKPLYLICFTAFTLLQIPTALAKTLPVLIALRTFAGFFGSTYTLMHRDQN
jgi:predicted MFS family arabinose efflux permease